MKCLRFDEAVYLIEWIPLKKKWKPKSNLGCHCAQQLNAYDAKSYAANAALSSNRPEEKGHANYQRIGQNIVSKRFRHLNECYTVQHCTKSILNARK